MQEVIARTQSRLEEFGRRPLYTFLADRSVSPEVRLSFVPRMAHFIMSFADLCTLILHEEPARDEFAHVVNAHAVEDSDHWRWYLHDLGQLGLDRPQPISDALRFLWGKETARARMLTYRLCQLSLGQSSLQKLVVILALEAMAKLGFEHTARVARELDGRELVYFGGRHIETELDHSLLDRGVQQAINGVQLDEGTRRHFCQVVDRVFDAFIDLIDELHPEDVS
jgi:hypothetical protein